MTAAELIAARVHAQLEARIAWLGACGGADAAPAEQAWLAEQELTAIAEATERLAGPEGAAWIRLVSIFALSEAEQALLQLALAIAIEPALGPMTARAQQAEGRLLPTEALAKRIAGLPARPIYRPTAPLAFWALLSPVQSAPGEPAGFEADPRLVDWMFGTPTLDRVLVPAVTPPPDDTMMAPEWPLVDAVSRLRRMLEAGQETRLLIEARPGSGRRRFAIAVAQALGARPLLVDPAGIPTSDWADAFMRLQRFALYVGGAPIWRDGGPAWPAKPSMAPVQILCIDEGATPPSRDAAVDLRVALPEPAVSTKAALWRRLSPGLPFADEMRIAATPGLSLADLEQAARTAPANVDEVSAQLRAVSRARLEGIGRAVDPRFDWDDLVLPEPIEQALRRLAFEAELRATVLAEEEARRMFAGASGLSALFSGPPGVGKSMAAQVIARALGVNLLVVDLASITSKYVGETAKNLSQAFARARAAGAALLFEEADALFARRTEIKDVNDRHANADTGHLLQLMEDHGGSLVILSTNKRANIDPAFIRRLRHTIDFPRPGLRERERIWAAVLAALGAGALKKDVSSLATRYDLSPAQIKSAALTARYAALADRGRAMSVDDLETAVQLELTKEGRSMATADVRPIPRSRMTLRG